jgi:hypothetical protein
MMSFAEAQKPTVISFYPPTLFVLDDLHGADRRVKLEDSMDYLFDMFHHF